MYWEMSSDEDRHDNIKHLLKLNPSKLQKVTTYVYFNLLCDFSLPEYVITIGENIHANYVI